MNEAYVQGFMQKCAEYGVDPEELVKSAQYLYHYVTRVDPETGKRHHVSVSSPNYMERIKKMMADPEQAEKARSWARKSKFTRGLSNLNPFNMFNKKHLTRQDYANLLNKGFIRDLQFML